MTTTRKAHVAVLAANFIFGANYSIVKFLSPFFIKSLGLNVTRVLVSLVLFWILYLLKPSNVGIQKKHLGRFILCSATGVAINQMLFIKGLTLSTPIHGALITLATPIFITFIAAWLLKEKLGWNKIVGLMLGISGAIVLVMMKDSTGSGTNIMLGDGLILINAISYAFYIVMVRPLMKAYSPVHVLRWVFTFGTLMILPFGFTQFMETDWSAFTLNAWLALMFIVIGATFIAYLFNIYGINKIGASLTGAYIYTQPVFTAIIATIFFHESFSLQKIVAALLIFCGVYLATFKRAEVEEKI